MYPDRWHPVFMLIDALKELGVAVEFAKDERTHGCWGMVFPEYGNRVMVWLIDNRLPHEAAKEDVAAIELLKSGAIVAHAQKPDMNRVGGAWLPLAVSPGYRNLDGFKTHDVAFVGFVRDAGRAKALAEIGAKFRLNFKHGVFGDEAVEAYCTAKCGVNIPSHFGTGLDYDLNMRCFEIPACGVPLVAPENFYLAYQGFNDMQTCVTFGKNRSLIEAIQIAMDNPQIGAAGQALVERAHTYIDRAKTVKEWLETRQGFFEADNE
jgi:hypothetical protein